MKRKDFLKDARSLSVEKISAKITEAQKQLVNLQQAKILGKLKNVREITHLRKDVARYQSVRDEKLIESINE